MPGLTGLRVIDLSTGIAGPFCAKLLADAGAEVIKVENPKGCDPARREIPCVSDAADSHTSALHIFLNQNKQSVSLDIATVSGKAIFKQLVDIADVIIESSAPGTMEALGLGYGDLVKTNPGIIFVSITDFGQSGPYRDYQGDHMAISALGGWSWTFGDSQREPLQVGFPVMYYMSGIYGAIGALAALYGRDQGGEGQHVDVSAHEACLNILGYPQVLEQFNCPPLRRDFSAVLQTFYVEAKDGWVALNHLTASQWENMCALVGVFHLAEDPTVLYDMDKKRALMPEFMAAARDWAKDKSQLEAFHAAQELSIPAGIPYSPKELLEAEQLLARDFFVEATQPDVGKFVQPKAPFPSVSRRSELSPAPVPGQDNVKVLQQLGLRPDDLRKLRNANVI